MVLLIEGIAQPYSIRYYRSLRFKIVLKTKQSSCGIGYAHVIVTRKCQPGLGIYRYLSLGRSGDERNEESQRDNY